jgi:alpha-L-fucosidase
MASQLTMKGDTSWFTHDRFGMFIHWGLYALAARHEWVQFKEKILREQYLKYFKHFEPDLYNPELWARAASCAGMKYFVITTKHHEGFCLWDTRQTDYKAPNTPAGRDLLAPMIKAFRGQNLRVGLYHSLIDWHHPQYILDPHHGPYRDHPERVKMNKGRNQANYAKYLHAQVRELLTRFKPVDILWFDYSYPQADGSGKGHKDWQSEKLIKMIRKLAPKVILNDRLDLPSGWDVKTPEQVQPREWLRVNGRPVVWEACQTFSGSWGYHRDESSWRSVDELIRTLIDCVAKGGNLLLNVGPTGRGEFDERALDRLRGMGEWMKRHGRSIHGCTQAPAEFVKPENCNLTWNPDKKRLYVHVLAWPYKHLHLDGNAYFNRVEYAQLLNDASEITLDFVGPWHPCQGTRPAKREKTITLNLPVIRPNVTVPVIELFLK